MGNIGITPIEHAPADAASVAAGAVAMMPLGQITVSSEVGIGLIVTIGGGMAGAIGFMYRQMVANHEAQLAALRADFTAQIATITSTNDKQMAALNADRKSWREMSEELAINIEKSVNRRRASLGQPPFHPIESIVPEHSSPVTGQQQETADIGTMRARLVRAVKELGEEPRAQPPPATAVDEAVAAVAAPLRAAETANALIAESESERKVTVADAVSDAKGAIDVAKVAIVAVDNAIKTDAKEATEDESREK